MQLYNSSFPSHYLNLNGTYYCCVTDKIIKEQGWNMVFKEDAYENP